MKFVSVIHKISQRIEIISCIAIVAMMLIVGINCITRQFDLPLKGTYDIACFLLVLITAPALCRCAVEDGHIRLDMLTNKFPKKAQYIVDNGTNPEVVAAAKERNIPIRVGVNTGSVSIDIAKKYGRYSSEGLVYEAKRHIDILENNNFNDIVISLKASDV